MELPFIYLLFLSGISKIDVFLFNFTPFYPGCVNKLLSVLVVCDWISWNK